MLKEKVARLQSSVLGGAFIIGSFSLLSRVIGLVRDRLLSSTYGAGELLDAYYTAFKIPDFFFNILVLGMMSASFVPVFLEYKTKNGQDDAMKIAAYVLNIIMAVLVAIIVICFIFAPQIIAIIAYADTPAQQEQIVSFMRVMLGSLFLFGISNVFSGILNSFKDFLIYSLAPIFYNIGIIVGVLVLAPQMGNMGLSLGVVLGALLHMLVQLPTVLKHGFTFRWGFGWRHPGVRQILRLMPPRALALGVTQLNIIIIFTIASSLSEGDRTVWQFADNLQHFPINIFGVSLALAAFPVFSQAFADNDMKKFREVFSENFRRILFYIIPISMIALILRAQIVRLVYGGNNFDWEDTILTADVLGIFTFSMYAQALIPLFARSFFAKQDTKTPVAVSIIAVIVNALLAWFLAPAYGIYGLAFAFSASAILQMLLLLIVLRLRHGNLDDAHIIDSTVKIILASIVMGLVMQGISYQGNTFIPGVEQVMASLVDMQTFWGIALQSIISILIGSAVFFFIVLKFHFDEAEAIVHKIRRLFSILQKGNK